MLPPDKPMIRRVTDFGHNTGMEGNPYGTF